MEVWVALLGRLICSPDLTETFHSDGNNLYHEAAVQPFGEVLKDVGPAGEVTLTRITRDKVYGTFAPVGSPITTRLPSGLTRSIEVVRDSVDASNASVLRSRLKINNDLFTSAYDRTTRRLTLTRRRRLIRQPMLPAWPTTPTYSPWPTTAAVRTTAAILRSSDEP